VFPNSFTNGSPLNMLNKLVYFLRKVSRVPKRFYDLNLIRMSGLFDEIWYLENNPDVARAKTNPILHYLRQGGFEGRDPGPDFCSYWYLDTYADVKKAGINPLIHYLRYGRKEGRLALPKRVGDFSFHSEYMAGDNVNGPLLSPSRKQKIFCVGYSKTGTTSIERALRDLGYKVGVQSEAEILMDDWAMRDFRRIIQYCETADAFQDLPFSVDFTFQILDYAFPGSKFILTIRSDADEWYESLIRFYKKIMKTTRTPIADDLKMFPYGGEGWFWRQEQNIFGVDESNFLDKQIYKAHYTNYNNRVLEYFRFRPKDLLVLNLADPSAMKSLCEFLGIKYVGQIMPYLNQSKN